MKISAVIIVKNAEHTISPTLESLKSFDEVIVYDNGATDKTLVRAGKFNNVRIIFGSFIGFGPTKNKAASYAKNDWILSIDSDEVISPELLNSIQEAVLDDNCVYGFDRYNYYRKKRVRFSGWRKETIYRIYNRKTTGFNNKMVHEGLVLENVNKVFLQGELRHYSYQKISDFIRKRDLYSDLFAEEKKGKKWSSPLRAILSSVYVFINTYFIRLGFLDGYRGILIAFSDFTVTFFKYLKLYEANLENDIKSSLIIFSNNTPDILKKTLDSVLFQVVPPDEIIIADNHSGMEIQKFVQKFEKKSFIPIKYLRCKSENAWMQYNGNEIINNVKHKYIILINDAIVLNKKYVHDHLCKLKKGKYLVSRKVSVKPIRMQRVNNLVPGFIELSFRQKISSFVSSFFISDSHIACSFFKDDYPLNTTYRLVKSTEINQAFVTDLAKAGLKRKNLRLSGIYYYIKELETHKKVLVCLDRLKFLNCGLGQVALNFGRELIDVQEDNVKFDYLLPEKGFAEFEDKIGNIKLNLYRYFVPNYMKSYDLCHITHQLPSFKFGKAKKNLLTIHDLNFVYKKSKVKKRKYLNSLQDNINKSDAIVFISEFSKQMAYEYLKIPKNKIVRVIHNGVQAPGNFSERPDWLPNKKFLFSIGQFLEKKNFHVLLPFMKQIPDDYILVIAGESNTSYGSKLKKLTKELEISNKVLFPGGVSEEDKSYLYHHCEAFLFPSIAEGFGLPVIEAMLCSRPVFCSNRTSLEEIGGNFAFFWKNFETDYMVETFYKGLELFKDETYKLKQKEYAKSYTYKKNVSEYVKLYKELLNNDL